MPITDISPHFHFSSPLSLFSLPTLPTASLAGLALAFTVSAPLRFHYFRFSPLLFLRQPIFQAFFRFH
jgi:hypothetical protein